MISPEQAISGDKQIGESQLLKHCDRAARSDPLPSQPQYQGLNCSLSSSTSDPCRMPGQ